MKNLVFIFALLCAAPCYATTYYVDNCVTVGNDSNNGTSAGTPWLTIAHVDSQSFSAGDIVQFQGGCYWHEAMVFPSSGSSGNPVTIRSYGTGQAVISGANIIGSWSAALGSQLLNDANTVALYNFANNLNDSGSNGYTQVTGASSPTYITGVYGSGITGNSAWYSGDTTDQAAFNFGTASFTMECVMQYTSTDAGTPACVGKGSSGSGGRQWAQRYANGFKCAIADAAGHYTQAVDAGNYADGVWRDFACVVNWSTSFVDIYVNGTRTTHQAFTASTGSTSSATAFYVGVIDSQLDNKLDAVTNIAQVKISNVIVSSFPSSITAPPANVWQATDATQPDVAIFNETLGTVEGSVAAITAANEWYWAANLLSVYSIGSPTSTYTAPGIQAGARAVELSLGTLSNVTLNNVLVEGANNQNILAVNGSGANVIISGNEIRYAGSGQGLGIALGSSAAAGAMNITGNTIHDNYGDGINMFLTVCSSGTPCYAQLNNIYNNGGNGVEVRGNYWTVQNNLVTNNGPNQQSSGLHIYTSSGSEHMGQNNTFLYNFVTLSKGNDTSGDGAGMAVDQWATGNTIAYNVLANNKASGIYLFDADHNLVYNNSTYGNSTGDSTNGCRGEIQLVSSLSLTANNTIENNAAQSTVASIPAICVDAASAGLSNTYSHNLWFAAATNWWSWSGTGGSSLATWNAHTGVSADLNADPKFNVSSLTLQAGSPAIDAGANLGSTYQNALSPLSYWPTGVMLLNQNTFGSGWDIGAFIYGIGPSPVQAFLGSISTTLDCSRGTNYIGHVTIDASPSTVAPNPYLGKVCIVPSAPAGVNDPYLGQVVVVGGPTNGAPDTYLGEMTEQ